MLLLGGLLISMANPARRPEAIYMEGPEVLTASAKAIVAGPVSAYSRQVLLTAEPPGPDAIPLEWSVSASIADATALKGTLSGPISFVRKEQSIMMEDERPRPAWELAYGDLRPSAPAVLFVADDRAAARAIPSGHGDLDLITLVREIVAIQARPSEFQTLAWVDYLNGTQWETGREAALRSLVRQKVDWKTLRPALEQLLKKNTISDQTRRFTFGIVTFGLTGNTWARDEVSIGEFLGRQLGTAQQTRLALQYLLQMKLALKYSMEEAARAARTPLRTQLVTALKANESSLSRAPELAEQYRQIRAAYPDLL